MPFVTSGQLVERTSLAAPTVNTALADLEQLAIVREITGRQREQANGSRRYLDLRSEGTEPLPISQ